MTSQAVTARPEMLSRRRFAVRFLGRPGAWLWLAGTGAFAAASWALVGLPARGTPDAERTWSLWSGNVLLALFVATMLFVVRKWSVKLRFFRDYGRAPPEDADLAWSELQQLNVKIRQGAYANDAEILAAARAVLARRHLDRSQRVELRTVRVGSRDVKFVQAVKKDPFGRLEPWLEMHMGVGVAACLGVLLHADLTLRHPVGWVLLIGSMILLATGLVGAALYRVVPEKLVGADIGIPYEEAGVARATCQECIAGVLATLDEGLRAELAPLLAPAHGDLAGARERNAALLARTASSRPADLDLVRDLVVLAGTRDRLERNTVRARRYDLWLRVWRWIHVPVTVLLFFAIALHVWAVLWY
jgi:hypothetical protein